MTSTEQSGENNITEVLQHRISWFLRGDDAPGELDEISINHIESLIIEGYHCGELVVSVSDGTTEYRGWWFIASP